MWICFPPSPKMHFLGCSFAFGRLSRSFLLNLVLLKRYISLGCPVCGPERTERLEGSEAGLTVATTTVPQDSHTHPASSPRASIPRRLQYSKAYIAHRISPVSCPNVDDVAGTHIRQKESAKREGCLPICIVSRWRVLRAISAVK